MTAELLEQIREMNGQGLNDAIIAERIYCSDSTVGNWRRRLNLPPAGINRTKKLYAIYDGKTTQFLMEGSARECAEYMGITKSAFHSHKARFERGEYKKYEIYEVKE